jgi:hypothetical protein
MVGPGPGGSTARGMRPPVLAKVPIVICSRQDSRVFWGCARLALLALLCFSGCGRFRTTHECRRLSEIVETGRREIDRVAAAKTPAAYRGSAPLYARIAGQLRLAAGSSELRSSADDYARSVETVGRSVSAYAEALASGDTARESSARRDLENASRKERLSSRRLEDLCHGRIQVF